MQNAPSRGRNRELKSGFGSHKRGFNTKVHLAVDAHGLPVRVLVTAGTVADCTQSGRLIENIPAEMLIADRGYDTDALLVQTLESEMEAVIPPRKHRKIQRKYGKECISCAIWSRMQYFTSNSGVALLHAMPRIQHLFLPQFLFGAWSSGET